MSCPYPTNKRTQIDIFDERSIYEIHSGENMPDIHMLNINPPHNNNEGDINQILNLITSLDPISIFGVGEVLLIICTSSRERIKGKGLIANLVLTSVPS